jgi:predicted DNA-binding transcriptional regulator YafY
VVERLRLDGILRQLSVSDNETLSTLAARFEVSRNTMQRNVRFLADDEHYPIETIRGNGGGVVLRITDKRYRDTLSSEHKEFLVRQLATADANDTEIINDMWKLFA